MVLYLHDDLSTDPDYVVDRIVYAVRRRQSLLVRTHTTPHNADMMMRARGFESIVTCTSQEHPRAPQPAACVCAEVQPDSNMYYCVLPLTYCARARVCGGAVHASGRLRDPVITPPALWAV